MVQNKFVQTSFDVRLHNVPYFIKFLLTVLPFNIENKNDRGDMKEILRKQALHMHEITDESWLSAFLGN